MALTAFTGRASPDGMVLLTASPCPITLHAAPDVANAWREAWTVTLCLGQACSERRHCGWPCAACHWQARPGQAASQACTWRLWSPGGAKFKAMLVLEQLLHCLEVLPEPAGGRWTLSWLLCPASAAQVGHLLVALHRASSELSVRLPCLITVMPHAGTATSLVVLIADRRCLAHSTPSEAAGRAHQPPESRPWPAPCRPLLIPGTLPAGLFSATQTEAVEQLARAGLRNPVRVNVVTNVAAPAPAPAARPGAGQATPAAEEPQPAASPAAAAAPGTRRTPASLALQYMICESTQKLDVLAAFLQVRLCSCRQWDQSILRMRGGVGLRPLGSAPRVCQTHGCCRHTAAVDGSLYAPSIHRGAV